jgi:hypothetical protein
MVMKYKNYHKESICLKESILAHLLKNDVQAKSYKKDKPRQQ